MFKRIMMATVAAFFVSLKSETRRSVSKYTRRIAFVVGGVFVLVFINIMISFLALLVVMIK